MENQKELFKVEEGDNYFLRNKAALSKSNDNDLIIQILKNIEISPIKVLEIGCANGIKLINYSKVFGSECYGIDPSSKAIEEGRKAFPELKLEVGTAESLPFDDNKFDTIIFGFCLYLCDRKDLFKIAYEADRCLSDNGILIILDFQPHFPYKKKYAYKEGVFSYKMNYANLFISNPSYSLIFNTVYSHAGYSKRDIPDEKIGISILSKKEEFAYSLNPYDS